MLSTLICSPLDTVTSRILSSLVEGLAPSTQGCRHQSEACLWLLWRVV